MHGGAVVNTAASQQDLNAPNPGRGFEHFRVEFACSPRVSVGLLRDLRFPPTVQRHAD